MQQITGCTGDNCPKAKDCELYYENLAKKLKTSFPMESWATFGSTTMWVNQETGKSGCKDEWYCGPNGEYKMFKQFVKNFDELSLGEIKQICKEHQKQNKDCEICKIHGFCFKMFTGSPSGWNLDK